MRMLIRNLVIFAALAACARTPETKTVTKPDSTHDLILIGGTVAAGPQQSPQKNLAIYVSDGHVGVANSAAMRAAGVTRETKDPEGGRIIRDAERNPTGTFIDDAQTLIESKIPPPSFEQRKNQVLHAAQTIAANGLTEMHD